MTRTTTTNVPPYVAATFGEQQGKKPRVEAQAMIWALQEADLSAVKPTRRAKARLLLGQFALASNRFGVSEHFVCWPGYETMEKYIDTKSRNTIREILQALQSANLIAIHKAKIVNGKKRSNCYELNCKYRFSNCKYHSNTCNFDCKYRRGHIKDSKQALKETKQKGSDGSKVQEDTGEDMPMRGVEEI